MQDVTVSDNPRDYLSGPTGNQSSRTEGGTNRSGGMSRVVVDAANMDTESGAAPEGGPSTPAP